MGTQYESEAMQAWSRKNYSLEDLSKLSTRERAEKETNRDLTKCIEQLLCDFHEQAEISMDGVFQIVTITLG